MPLPGGPINTTTRSIAHEEYGTAGVNLRVGAPKRARPHLPDDVEVVQRRLDEVELTVFEGIPTTTVRRAVLDCRDLVMRDRLLYAARDAARRGLLRRDQADRVISEIGDAA